MTSEHQLSIARKRQKQTQMGYRNRRKNTKHLHPQFKIPPIFGGVRESIG